MPRIRSRMAHRQPAFSLVELMIVFLVIALLIGILVPVLSKAYKTALATADTALIHQIAMGAQTYHLAFNAYPPAHGCHPRAWWPPPPIPSAAAIANTLYLTAQPSLRFDDRVQHPRRSC